MEKEASVLTDRLIIGVLAVGMIGGLHRFVAPQVSVTPSELSNEGTRDIVHDYFEDLDDLHRRDLLEKKAREVAAQARKEAQEVVDKFYNALSHAETGSFDNPWIRTVARPSRSEKGSTAWGPLQITATLVKDFKNRFPDLFTSEVADYAARYLEQAKLFNHYGYALNEQPRADHDPIYDYGGTGTLAQLAQDRENYKKMGKALLDKIIEQCTVNGVVDKDEVIKRWRGVSEERDPEYYDKVRSLL